MPDVSPLDLIKPCFYSSTFLFLFLFLLQPCALPLISVLPTNNKDQSSLTNIAIATMPPKGSSSCTLSEREMQLLCNYCRCMKSKPEVCIDHPICA